MSAISDNLIHFLARADKESPVKQFEVFRSIMENGLRTGPIQIKFPDGASVFNQIICFTDIPLRECAQHTAVYGKFGIGFKKSYVKRVGGNPARYFLDFVPGKTQDNVSVEARGALFLHLWHLNQLMNKLNERLAIDPEFGLLDKQGEIMLKPEEVKGLVNVLLHVFSYDKEMGDLGPARDESREIDLYYKEREWRLVPSNLSEQAGHSKIDEATKRCTYQFQRADVNMIVVPNEASRLHVLQYLLGLVASPSERLKAFAVDPPPIINYDDLDRW